MFKKVTINLDKDKKIQKKIWVDTSLSNFEFNEVIREKYLFWYSIE